MTANSLYFGVQVLKKFKFKPISFNGSSSPTSKEVDKIGMKEYLFTAPDATMNPCASDIHVPANTIAICGGDLSVGWGEMSGA